jgi:trehalose 6-phosphate phosphatase
MSLDGVRARLGDALVVLDFDGTLAPIVPRPQDARPADGTVDALVALASRVRRLAVVTGRPATVVVELGALARVPGLVVYGHYGLQRWSGGRLVTPEPDPAVAEAGRRLPALPPGAAVEDKEHSLVVHLRACEDPVAATVAAYPGLVALATELDLELVGGRFVWELRPRGIDKGGALRALLADTQPSALLVAGDDVGDLPMFAAAAVAGIPAVRVAVLGADADPTVAAAADLTVADPAALVALLASL